MKPAGEVRPRGTTKLSTVTKSVIALFFCEAGSSWPRAESIPSDADTAVAVPADEDRPPGIAKQSATTESDIAVSSGEGGPSWARANGNSTADAAAVKSAGETRSSSIVKYRVTSESESELAEEWELARVALL